MNISEVSILTISRFHPYRFSLPPQKLFWTGGYENGELDFLKSTVLSKSTESVYMCSDMPMEDMAQDLEFEKKWMFGLAVMLKKDCT